MKQKNKSVKIQEEEIMTRKYIRGYLNNYPYEQKFKFGMVITDPKIPDHLEYIELCLKSFAKDLVSRLTGPELVRSVANEILFRLRIPTLDKQTVEEMESYLVAVFRYTSLEALRKEGAFGHPITPEQLEERFQLLEDTHYELLMKAKRSTIKPLRSKTVL